MLVLPVRLCSSLFFTDPPTPETYTLSLHDALPIWRQRHSPLHAEPGGRSRRRHGARLQHVEQHDETGDQVDRKSTRLNSSHLGISYAVFCLKKKKIISTVTMKPRNTHATYD